MITKIYRLHIRCDHYPCNNKVIYDGTHKTAIPNDWYQKYSSYHDLVLHYCPEHGKDIAGAQLGNPTPIQL